MICSEGRVFRVLNADGEASLRQTLDSGALRRFREDGALVSTRVLDPADMAEVLRSSAIAPLVADMDAVAVAEHEPARFPNYPHEWAPEMLHAAGQLTIDMALALLDDGMGLKDATPFNIMFDGPRPVLLDVLSLEKRDPRDPSWTPHAQFVRTFLLPLLANQLRGVPLDRIFTTRREGMEPEEVYPLTGIFQRLAPRVFPLVTFPAWFGKKAAARSGLYAPRRESNPEKAAFILRHFLRAQRHALASVRPSPRVSRWSGYMEGANNYGEGELAAKRDFVSRVLSDAAPANVLDLGCNTGEFSLVAAQAGAHVVAVDSDPPVVGRLWRAAQSRNAAVLPLVVNIAQPTPAVGWDNAECRSFLDRAAGGFDVVLMLALVHHLLVSERAPLGEIFRLARRLTRRLLIVEYVDPADSMFRLIARGREHLHRDFNRPAFEAAAAQHFRIVAARDVAGPTRCLYVLEAL